MFLTEEESKTKRCQEGYAASNGASRVPDTEYTVVTVPIAMASVSYASGGSYSASTSTAEPRTAPIFCLGSACMAWRWSPQQPRMEAIEGRKGYCGKAGKPE